jgi:dTMP kinase
MNYIIIEGPDGSGKTSLVSKLKDLISELGHNVEIVREPGGTPMAESLRALLKDKDIPRSRECEMLAMMAARADTIHTKVIPALDAGTVVLSDRGNPSTYAYQAHGTSALVHAYEKLLTLAMPIQPLYIFLDVSFEESMRRRADSDVDALEARYMTEDKFNELRKAYAVAAAIEPFSSVVDTSNMTKEQVCQEVLLIVRSHLVPFGRLV